MTALRIVHAVRSDGFAGVERHIASLAAAQDDAGHDVSVIGGDPSTMRDAIGRADVRHVPARTVADTARAIHASGRPDILHVHMTAAEVAALLAVRQWRVPAVTTRHFASRRGTGASGRAVGALAARRLGAQIAISHYVAQHVDGETTVVPTGVPSHPAARSAAEREPTVLIAQRLEPEKRTDVGLRAFAASGLASRGWELTIAGDGSQRGRLEALADELAVAGRVRFLGRRSDIDERMDRAGVLLATCPVEGLGLTVLEAMAHGLPVVAARAGGHIETLGGSRFAALYEPADVDHAGRLLADLAADPALRDAYGTDLRTVQRERYTVDEQARATETVYRSVL